MTAPFNQFTQEVSELQTTTPKGEKLVVVELQESYQQLADQADRTLEEKQRLEREQRASS